MRVFQINTFCGVKSTGRITTDIALLLEKQGGACRIAYGVDSVPAVYERFACKIGTALERKLHGGIRKLLDGEGYGSHLGTLRLICEIKAFKPDVIHLHNLHGCYINLRMLFRFLKRSDIQVVWTLHDCWPFTGHCAYFDYAGCDKWQTHCEHCPQLRSYPTCLGLDGSRRNFAHKKKLFTGLSAMTLVPPCHWLETHIKGSFMREYPVRVIYNGVNRDTFHPVDGLYLRNKYRIASPYIALAVAADWDERKGLPYLIQAAQALGPEYQVVAVGLESPQIAELPQGILGIERTESVTELAAWYSLSDCLVNPTLEDNMPLVNLEALACGTPVACFATGGCVEAVDSSCGRVVPKGDALALAEAVRELSAQKPQITEACIARAAQVFDSESCYQQYLDLYKEVCR